MKAFVNIQKRTRSTIYTSNGAMLHAIHTSPLDWQMDDKGVGVVELLSARRQLKLRLQEAEDELRAQPHTTLAALHDSGVFSGFVLLERRGFWRVEFDIPQEITPARVARMASDAADDHSNFGTY